MGWTIGMPSLKLNNVGKKSKHCGSFAGVAMEALEERKGRDPDIDRERSHLNVYGGITSAVELIKYSKEHVEELSAAQRAAGKRGVREDAVVMCSTIIKPPTEMMAAMSREEQIRFLMDAMEKLDEVIGPDNGRSYAIHFDEQGGHLHRLWEPMTEDGRLCAKELHNVKFFGRLNREMPEFLRSRGWDIDDCECYDAAKEELETDEERTSQRKQSGRSSAVYKRDMERAAKKVKAQVEVLEQKVGILETELEGQKKLYDELQTVNEKNLQIIEKNGRIIREQEETKQLIRTYEQYLQEAQAVNEDIDTMEETAKDMAAKKFPPMGWPQLMQRLFARVRELVDSILTRMHIYENNYNVPQEKKLSVPAEKRLASLDEQIFGAGKRSQASQGTAPERSEPER